MRRLTFQHDTVCSNLICFWIDFYPRARVIQNHIVFAKASAFDHSLDAFIETVLGANIRGGGRGAHERYASLPRFESTEHSSHDDRLRSRNTCIWITHLRPRDLSAFNDDFWLGAEESWLPNDDVGEFSHF